MLTFTDRAREMVLTFLEQSEGELDALRIHAEGGSPVAPAFELTLIAPDERSPGDVQFDGGGFAVVVDPDTAGRIEGATVDFVERVNETGFEVTRPRGEPERAVPTGPIADRVQQILDQQVNPAVASHGGQILLVDVKDTEVFMEMTGGCQGCAMSRMTLRQGVERMIRQAVPEVTMIHDVTDHTSGDNPYFSA